MKKNKTLIISTIVCLLPIVLALVLYPQLPDQIVIHFDSAGNPDNYLPKPLAVFGLPVAFALINILSYTFRKNEPRSNNIPDSMKSLTMWLIPLLSVVVLPISLFVSMGINIPVLIPIQAIVGLILIACGNYMPKTKQNYSVGIKLPWTLHSEANWNKTHHFAGYLWIIGGMSIVIIGCLNLNLVALNIGILALLVLLPILYSFLTYKKEMKKKHCLIDKEYIKSR